MEYVFIVKKCVLTGAASRIRSKANDNVYLLLTVESGDRVLVNTMLPRNIVSGRLPMVATTTVSGDVKVFGVFKHHAVSTCHCDIVVFVSNATIKSSSCRPGLRI